MRRLNGWQRLWVVVLLLWAVPLGVFGWGQWPLHPRAVSGEIRTAYHETRQWDGAEWRVIATFEDPSAEFARLTVFASDGYAFRFHEGTDPQAAIGAVGQALRAERAILIAKLAATWLVSGVALYAFGWSCAWVRRGFKSTS
jgi:hypothetical protein